MGEVPAGAALRRGGANDAVHCVALQPDGKILLKQLNPLFE